MNIDDIRKDFPQLKQGFIYFDSGATTLKPNPVIEAVTEFYESLSANVGRGLHRPSHLATKAYDKAHDKVQKFFNAKGEIVFTKNCTEAINIVAHGLDWQPGDKVITTYLEHNANLLPWLNLRSRGIEVVVLKCAPDGTLNLKELQEAIDDKTKLVTVIHASNVLGSIMPVEDITEIAKNKGAFVLIDGAQAVPHLKVDFDAIGCDFYAASGHKMLGPTGTGFLYIKSQSFEKLQPMLLGGGAVSDVELEKITLVQNRERFEAGTPNIAGCIGLGAAVDYLNKIGMSEIRKHELELTGYLIERLKKFGDLKIFGPEDLNKRTGVVSFSVKNIPAHRIAIILDEVGGIAIRSGFHCAFLLTREILKEHNGTARVSLYIYNTKEEIDKLISILNEVVKNV